MCYYYLNSARGPLYYYDDDDQEIGDCVLFTGEDQVDEFIEMTLNYGGDEDFFEETMLVPFDKSILREKESTVLASTLIEKANEFENF